eukprot:1643761-Karenia_brevis.AAC.1
MNVQVANVQGPLICPRERCHPSHSCAPITKAAPPAAWVCAPTPAGTQTARHPRPCGRLPEPR